MIDRKTALLCAGVIALMFAATFWRITSPQEWPAEMTAQMAQMAWARTLSPPVLLFVPPAGCALVTAGLYWRSFRVSADDPRFEAWQRLGTRLSISYCAGLSLMQGFLVARSLGLHLPPGLGMTLGVLMMIVALLVINQMPKLPWLETRFSPGGELGPVYGPRFLRIRSKVLVVFAIAMLAAALVFFAAPATFRQRWAVPTILGGGALFVLLFVLWNLAWRIHLARKWRLERAAQG